MTFDRSTACAGMIAVLLASALLFSQPAITARSTSAAGVRGESSAENPALGRLRQWLRELDVHSPGHGDVPATIIAQWSRQELETLVGDLRRLSAFLQRTANSRDRSSQVLQLYNRRMTREEIETLFHGNETLLAGAVLHADIAVFIADDFTRLTDTEGIFVVQDGRRT